MNEKMIDILDILDKEENSSQREIARRAGISLGLVNTLIKKCAKKGLLKIERLNSRNIRYILTPAGIKELSNRTINYIKKSYLAIQKMQWKIQELAEKHRELGKRIYILNEEKDEIFQLVQSTLNDLNIEYSIIDKKKFIDKIAKDNKNYVIYHWNPELEFKDELKDENLEIINIFQI